MYFSPWGFFGANQRLVEGEAYGALYGDDWARDEAGNALVDAWLPNLLFYRGCSW